MCLSLEKQRQSKSLRVAEWLNKFQPSASVCAEGSRCQEDFESSAQSNVSNSVSESIQESLTVPDLSVHLPSENKCLKTELAKLRHQMKLATTDRKLLRDYVKSHLCKKNCHAEKTAPHCATTEEIIREDEDE